MTIILRNLADFITEALQDSPVLLINGARQTGKSTLAQELKPNRRYITLDDPVALSAAHSDPFGFIAGINEPVCIDEIQRAPDLFLAIKVDVDKNRTPGKFLLTGSANILLLPKLSDSLAGRMEILELWPLSQSEIENQQFSLIDQLFDGDFASNYKYDRNDFIDRLIIGGYPEVLNRTSERRRESWFNSYLTTILQKDVRDISQISDLAILPRLLQILAIRNANLLNFAELSRTTTISQTTLKRYMTLLETLFLIRLLPAWSSNLGKRLQKSPKIFMSDYGLSAHLQGLDKESLQLDHGLPGGLVESFVFTELSKHQTWANKSTQLMHYRTTTGIEVDFVLENRKGDLIGIEVKAAATVVAKDFKGLRHLQETTPKQFKRGILFYTGDQVISFGNDMLAVPIAMLWNGS